MADKNKQEPAKEAAKPATGGKDVPPSVKAEAFSCPHCGAYTHQYWYTVRAIENKKGVMPFLPDNEWLERLKKRPEAEDFLLEHFTEKVARINTGKIFFEKKEYSGSDEEVESLHLSQCFTCNDISIWVRDRLIFPSMRTGPHPNSDLPDHIRADYEEARSILDLSARGAAALLRLCVEKLCIHMKAQGKSLDEKIADLVKKGLDPRIQKPLDAVRVIGNEAVHPGQLDLKDDRDTAETLFRLVNLITEKLITEPKHVDEIYRSLPPEKLAAIERRDKGKSSN